MSGAGIFTIAAVGFAGGLLSRLAGFAWKACFGSMPRPPKVMSVRVLSCQLGHRSAAGMTEQELAAVGAVAMVNETEPKPPAWRLN